MDKPAEWRNVSEVNEMKIFESQAVAVLRRNAATVSTHFAVYQQKTSTDMRFCALFAMQQLLKLII